MERSIEYGYHRNAGHKFLASTHTHNMSRVMKRSHSKGSFHIFDGFFGGDAGLGEESAAVHAVIEPPAGPALGVSAAPCSGALVAGRGSGGRRCQGVREGSSVRGGVGARARARPGVVFRNEAMAALTAGAGRVARVAGPEGGGATRQSRGIEPAAPAPPRAAPWAPVCRCFRTSAVAAKGSPDVGRRRGW